MSLLTPGSQPSGHLAAAKNYLQDTFLLIFPLFLPNPPLLGVPPQLDLKPGMGWLPKFAFRVEYDPPVSANPQSLVCFSHLVVPTKIVNQLVLESYLQKSHINFHLNYHNQRKYHHLQARK